MGTAMLTNTNVYENQASYVRSLSVIPSSAPLERYVGSWLTGGRRTQHRRGADVRGRLRLGNGKTDQYQGVPKWGSSCVLTVCHVPFTFSAPPQLYVCSWQYGGGLYILGGAAKVPNVLGTVMLTNTDVYQNEARWVCSHFAYFELPSVCSPPLSSFLCVPACTDLRQPPELHAASFGRVEVPTLLAHSRSQLPGSWTTTLAQEARISTLMQAAAPPTCYLRHRATGCPRLSARSGERRVAKGTPLVRRPPKTAR